MTGKMISKDFFLEMISGRSLPQIEQIEEFTRNYPWCAIGHKMLFKVLCAQSDEAYHSYASKVSVYLFDKEELFTLAHAPRTIFPMISEPFVLKGIKKEEKPQENEADVFEVIPDTAPVPEPVPTPAPVFVPKPVPPDPVERIVIAGGDYFAQSILDTAYLEEKNPIDRFIITNPKLTPVQLFQEEKEEKEEKVSLRNVGDDNFMTETLAKIYADQSLYQLAIEAYKKLILLYPKKSDYFASLIKDIKIKMNR